MSTPKKQMKQYEERVIFFFLISNKTSLIKKETPKHTGSIQGRTNQKRKLQKSSKFRREKEWFLHTENHSSKVRKKKSLMSGIWGLSHLPSCIKFMLLTAIGSTRFFLVQIICMKNLSLSYDLYG